MCRSGLKLIKARYLAVWLTSILSLTLMPAYSLLDGSPDVGASTLKPGTAAKILSADWTQSSGPDFIRGTLENIDISGQGSGAVSLATVGGKFSLTGVYTSVMKESNFPFNAVGIQWRAYVPDGTEVAGEIRTSADGTNFTEWKQILIGADAEDRSEDGSSIAELVLTPFHRWAQYRINLRTEDPGITPLVDQVSVTFIDSSRGPNLTEAKAAAIQSKDESKPAIIPRSAWGADESLRYRNGKELWPVKRQPVRKFIIHHSVTQNNDPNPPATIRAIYQYHAVELGWGDIGYNYLIDAQGNIYEGRFGGDDVVAGHAKQYNYGSMGITVLGNYDTARVASTAKNALVRLIGWNVLRYGIYPNGSTYLIDKEFPNIAGHSDVLASTCPGNFLESEIPDIRSKVVSQIPVLGLKWEAHSTPSSMQPGQTVSVEVGVSNRGRDVWVATGNNVVRLGYHWHQADDTRVGQNPADDKLSDLPGDVTFGQSVIINALVKAPEEPGVYTLKWDLVQNSSNWLSDKGLTPLEVEVRVGQPPLPSPTPGFSGTEQSTWYFAEGSTMRGYQTVFLLMNPGPDPANVKFAFMTEGGSVVKSSFAVGPTSRLTINANDIIPNANMSTKVESDRKIYVERTMVFGHDGHTSPGASQPSNTWFFAEGSTGWGFATWLLLMNPNPEETRARVTFFKENGQPVVKDLQLKGNSRLNVFANKELPNANIATKVEADRPIVAERSMYMDGGKGGHGTVGATEGSTSWLFAEGYTGPGVHTWLLLMNPNNIAADVTATFFRESGEQVVKRYSVPATSRLNILVNQVVPNVAVSTKIEASLPIVAERSMYFSDDKGAHNTIGATKAAKTWYLPEGYTGSGVGEWILILNPESNEVSVDVTFMKSDGTTSKKSIVLGPHSRYTIYANSLVRGAELSAKVEASGPVVVERAIYFSDGQGGTASIGIPGY